MHPGVCIPGCIKSIRLNRETDCIVSLCVHVRIFEILFCTFAEVDLIRHYQSIRRSNRNMPVAYCCHQFKNLWLPLFSSAIAEENANESRHLGRNRQFSARKLAVFIIMGLLQAEPCQHKTTHFPLSATYFSFAYSKSMCTFY